MCTSEKDAHRKLPYIRIDSNKRDDRPTGLPEIQLNHASDNSLPSSPGSPAQFGSRASSPTSKQKSSFFQSRKKQISLQPKLLIPTASLERSVSDCDPDRRPTSAGSEKPLTAPVLGERHQKARASIAFDFNILHYLTKGHYFNNNSNHANCGEGKVASSFFGNGRSKNKIKFSESNDKHSDLESFGSVISLIQRKEPNGKKKKKKKKKSKELDRQESSEPEQSSGKLKIASSGKKKKARKVLAEQRSNQQCSSASSSSSSLLSLNNLSSSIEKLTSKFKKEKKPRPAFDQDQMLHKYGRVIVPGEPRSFRSMMQWSPSSSRSNGSSSLVASLKANENSPKTSENSSRTNESSSSMKNTRLLDSNASCVSFVYTHQLPPTNPSLKTFRKEYPFARQANPQQYHHHHSRNCPHTHQHHCSTSKQPAERTLPESNPLEKNQKNSTEKQLAERPSSPNKQPSILERHFLEKQQLIEANQQNQSNKFSFFKNKILRSRSFDTPKSSKYQVSRTLFSNGFGLACSFASIPTQFATSFRSSAISVLTSLTNFPAFRAL